MFHEEQGADGVDREGASQLRVVELRGGLFRVQNPRNGEGEV